MPALMGKWKKVKGDPAPFKAFAVSAKPFLTYHSMLSYSKKGERKICSIRTYG